MLKFKIIDHTNVHLLKHMVLRKEDMREAVASTGFTRIFDALRFSVKCSNRWTKICYETESGEIIALFGLGGMPGYMIGVPWMVASPEISNYKKDLMRYSKRILRDMLVSFPRLENMVSIENTKSIRWLKHLGFSFEEKYMRIRGVTFKRFFIERTK
ncbi:MAG: DUF2833 domain-containing protein [Desulfobacteraceae bacterium]|nr:MAG: DUF2833 domain-containing protein [Desulfobacteraceae bacterium]